MSAPSALGPSVPVGIWVPCPTCWGQRRILEPVAAANGEGDLLVAMPCPACLGVGDVLRP
jgi:hypothetical protein